MVKIDLLVVDVEGSELGILKSVDWDAVFVRVLVVDMGELKVEFAKHVRKLLMEGGFCMVEKVGEDELWTADPKFKQLFCGWSSFKVDP